MDWIGDEKVWQRSLRGAPIKQRVVSITISLVLLLNFAIVMISVTSPSASAYVHGTAGSLSTADEDQGPNDANPTPFQVKWDASFDHYIEGNYTISPGYPLTIDPGCNVFFNGTYGITVESTLFAQGTSGSRITFTTNYSIPGPGNWSSIDFAGGGGTLEYCDIHYASEAVYINSPAAITINENRITHNVMGINGTRSSLSLVNNNISSNSQAGIRLDTPPSGLTFSATGNTILGNQVGISLNSQLGDITATITDNEISDSVDDGLYIYSITGDVTATVEGNMFQRNGFEAAYIIAEGGSATLNATVRNNDIIGNIYGIWFSDNYMAPGTHMVFNVSENNFFDNGDGVYVDGWSSLDGEIYKNNFTGNSLTVINCMMDDSDTQYRIIDNFLWQNGGGIFLAYYLYTPMERTLNAEISHNTFVQNTGSSADIWSDELLDFTLSNNEFIENEYAFYSASLYTHNPRIFDNLFQDNIGPGVDLIAYDDISLEMARNQVLNSSGDNLYIYTVEGGYFNITDNEFSQSSGSNGVYIDHFNGSGIFSNNVVANNDRSGIDFWEGNNITIIDSTFSDNQYGLTAYNSTVIVINSSISSSSNDFDLYGDSHFISLNTSFDNSSAIYGDSLSDLTVKWYLDVHVIDNLGSGVDDALVYVNDSLGSNEWSQSTGSGADGWVYFIPSTEYVENSSGKHYRTPHNVSAFKGGESGYEFPKIWQSRDVTVVLNSKPTVENLWPQGGGLESVFRGDTIFIHANASDTADPEDLLKPYFQHRDPGDISWNETLFLVPATYIGSSPTGYWSIQFSPGLGYTDLGWHDFRVRFQDTNGAFSDYVYSYNTVEVLNNPPEAISLTATTSTVLRGGSITIVAEGEDREDGEEDLIPKLEYSSDSGSSWEDTYLGTPSYNAVGQNWEIMFTPLLDAKLGLYDFRVKFSDPDGGESTYLVELNLVDIVNNLPNPIEIDTSNSNVLRTDTIFINADASDHEDGVDQLVPYFEYLDPQDSQWVSDYLADLEFTFNEWQIPFTPTSDAQLGNYDFRVRFEDTDGGHSSWIYLNDSVMVDNNLPSALDIHSSESEVVRGGVVFYFANGSDVEDQESELRCEFGSRIAGGSWENVSFSPRTYDNDFWWVGFSPGSDLGLGEYEIRVGFFDNDGGSSDWLALNVTLLNGPPSASNLGVTTSQIRRGESVIIHAQGNDYEDISSELSMSFQYRPSDSPSEPWVTLLGESYSGSENRFEIRFTPTSSFITGDYDLRVKAEDTDGDESPWLEIKKALEVLNSPPSVLDLSLSKSEMFREEELMIYANAQDVEDDEGDLEARFEYSFGGSFWETEYLGSPEYQSGQWQVSFTPSADANLGSFSFRVKFNDGDDESAWAYSNGSFLVKNNPPSVEIKNSGTQDGKEVLFSATVSDSEDSRSSLSFLWDFDDEGTSTSDGPLHTFEKPGTYSVTLTVTDSDGSETTDTSEIIIEGGAGVDDQGETGNAIPLVILLVVVVIVIVLILLLLMRRKKPEAAEALPPETPQQVPALQDTPTSAPVTSPPLGRTEQAQFKKTIKCPNCKGAFQVPFKKGTQKITCPHCGTSGNISL